jgi:hypothetical protein
MFFFVFFIIKDDFENFEIKWLKKLRFTFTFFLTFRCLLVCAIVTLQVQDWPNGFLVEWVWSRMIIVPKARNSTIDGFLLGFARRDPQWMVSKTTNQLGSK